LFCPLPIALSAFSALAKPAVLAGTVADLLEVKSAAALAYLSCADFAIVYTTTAKTTATKREADPFATWPFNRKYTEAKAATTQMTIMTEPYHGISDTELGVLLSADVWFTTFPTDIPAFTSPLLLMSTFSRSRQWRGGIVRRCDLRFGTELRSGTPAMFSPANSLAGPVGARSARPTPTAFQLRWRVRGVGCSPSLFTASACIGNGLE
jgi:hypothetical protein